MPATEGLTTNAVSIILQIALTGDASWFLYQHWHHYQWSNRRSHAMSQHELRTAHTTNHRQVFDAWSNHSASTLDRPSVSDVAFRLALSQLAAGTSVVTTCGQDGYKLGLTATAV